AARSGIRRIGQQHGVDHAEDRGGGADAQRQRETRGQRKSGYPAQAAHAVAEVPPRVFQEHQSNLIAREFLGGLDATKPDERLPSRLARRHAETSVLFDLLLEMKAQLGVEPALERGSAPPRPDASPGVEDR